MRPLGIVDAAATFGRFRYVELALFALTGEQSLRVHEPSLAVFFSSASSAHGYRAAMFEALLPVAAGLGDAAGPSSSFDSGIDEVFDRLGHLDENELFAALIDVIYAESRSGLEHTLKRLVAPSDGAAHRVLQRALFDLGLVLDEASALRLLLERPAKEPVEELAALVRQSGGLYGESAGGPGS